jgi:hypothetical protein
VDRVPDRRLAGAIVAQVCLGSGRARLSGGDNGSASLAVDQETNTTLRPSGSSKVTPPLSSQ